MYFLGTYLILEYILAEYWNLVAISGAVSSLPDHAFTPTPRKHGVERSTMKHSSETGVELPHV